MEGKRYDLIPGGLAKDTNPSNNESQEVSRGRSSEEVSVMEMEERRTEQKSISYRSRNCAYAWSWNIRKTSAMSRQRTDESGS